MNSERILEIFREITAIPRESGHEEPMTQYLMDYAQKLGLKAVKDSTGNVVITREATDPVKKGAPALVLQAHQDMVCEKNEGVAHDFAKDPIKYVIEDGWMIAKDTTLGADDGIGIAACLALLESDIPTAKLECLFTISEETGMDGAMALEAGMFTGNTLINLDSEDEGQLFVGCAGGVTTMATFSYKEEAVVPGSVSLKLSIYDAKGGHSGDDINKGRCNTVQQMARFLFEEAKAARYQLVSVDGGNKHNAIARECRATIALSAADAEGTKARFNDFMKALAVEFSVTDPEVKGSCAQAPAASVAIDGCTAKRLIASMVAVHHGVLNMSQDIPDLVETSNNLASVKMPQPGKIEICTSQRSSIESARDFIADKIEACFTLAGAEVIRMDPYPGWKPNLKSDILKLSVHEYKALFGYDPEVKAIHAGLECGLFLEKFPGLDMISFGPTLRGVHAPGEKLELASLDKFARHLEAVVKNYPLSK